MALSKVGSNQIDSAASLTVSGNVSVDGGTIKLDGNYPTGTSNVAIGDAALDDGSLSGGYNTAAGAGALSANTSGAQNTAVGATSSDANTTGSYNSGFGQSSLGSNTTGSSNTGLGRGALSANTTASNNTAAGYNALAANTTGAANTTVGSLSLDANTTGDNNSAFGVNALSSNTTADGNSAYGYQALYSNTTGASNVSVGVNSLFANTTASNNTAVGYAALTANTTGYSNVAMGQNAATTNTTGNENTYIGHASGGLSTGSNNAFLGQGSGYYSTGSSNTFLGKDAGVSMTSGSNNTIVGRYTGNNGGYDFRTSNNHIFLSDGGGNVRLYLTDSGDLVVPRVYNANTSNSANVQVDSAGIFRRSTSSRRYKNTITDATHGLTELLALRSVTYKGNDDGDAVFGGLIAEEVHDAGLTEFVQYNDDDEPDALAYGNMVSLCIKAIQELKTELNAAKARIATLEGE
tara:strand:+ start:35 stop:1426 length:1392 start_codon:yes stop_codon:yes gene_type:complete